MFACGWYNVKWFNKAGEAVKNENIYLTAPLYRQEVMKANFSALKGQDIEKIAIYPIEK